MTQNWGRLAARTLAAGTMALLLGSAQGALAQAVFGQILGTVTDATGAAIPNANVTVTDVAKGTSVTLQSNSAGEFTAEHLIPDTYTIRVVAPGFKGYEQRDLQIFADSAGRVAAVLVVGGSDQIVTVNADETPQLKTDRADVSTTFNAQEIEELPIPDHNFTNLQLLLPGAQQLGWAHAASENPQGSKQIQIDGQAFGGVNFTLDGTDNQDPILGLIVINPNSESMSEAKITTQNYDAEFGKAVASVETVQTKSGTNKFHGTLFDNRESAANLAREPFNQPKNKPIPQALKNQFGGSLGGPIWKDRAFFFADYQGVRQKVGTSNTQTVPTARVVSSCLSGNGCDFSEYLSPAGVGTQVPTKHVIYDPLTGLPFAGNIIPNSRLSPSALKLLKLLQPYTPNLISSSEGGLKDNYGASGTGVFNSNQWDVRGDVTINERVHAFGRFSRFTDTLTGTTVFGNAGGAGFGLAGFGGTSIGANDSLALGTDIAINSKLVTDVRLGYYRYNIGTTKYDQTNANLPFAGQNVSATGLTVTSIFGAPNIDIADADKSGNSGPGNGQNRGLQFGSGLNINHCNCPLKEKEDQFQIVNNWTKTLGNHAVKAGVDLRYARNLRVPSDQDRTGHDQFGAGPTSNGTGDTGLGLATLVLGDVTAFNRYASVSINSKEFQKRDFFYVQDTWRTTPKLTLNIGLRYELYGPERVNGAGNGALLNLDTGYINVAGIGSTPLNMGVGTAKFAFNPRLGVAYQYNDKTVIRAGYGRSFDLGVFGSEFGHVVTQNVPVLANQSITGRGNYSTYAFQLDDPTNTQGGKATGLSVYTPVAPDAKGQIAITAPIPNAPAGTTIANSVNVKARPFIERLPTLDAWNVAIQRSITPTLSLTVAYVGNKGTHSLSDGDGNNTNPNEPANVLPANYSITGSALHYDPKAPSSPDATGATSNTNNLRRFTGGTLPACGGPCGWNQDISYYGDDQDTHYNAIQISVTKAYKSGLSASGNYSYQRATSNASGYATWDKQAVIGNEGSVRRNSATIYGLYKLPFGRGQKLAGNANAFVDKIISGFEVSPVFVIQSGLPFSLGLNNCNNYGVGPCRPNGSASGLKLGSKGTPGTPGGVTFFAPPGLGNAGFTAPALDTIGNVGRNTAFGPGFFNSDMSLIKNITFRERYTAQLRMDAFNAFNHINYGNPDGNIESGGSIGSGPGPNGTANPRQLQFTAHLQF